MSAPTSPWLTTREACAYSGFGLSKVLTALHDGDLVGRQSGPGGRWRIHVDAVDAWLDGSRPAPRRRLHSA